MTDKNTWLVIPAYNEEAALADVLRSLDFSLYEIVLVDDCSVDRTLAKAQDFPVHICKHPINLGQGAAIQTGIEYALQHKARYIVTFDSDGQHRAEDIIKLLAVLKDEDLDIVLGSRFIDGAQAVNMPRFKYLVLKMAVAFTRLTTGLKLSDTHNGLRAFRAEAAAKLKITQNGMAHASQILSQIAMHKFKYKEVPVKVVYSEYSVAKGQKVSNAINILWDSFMELFWR